MTEHRIIRLGHHGDGIAEGPLYAAMTLPGETVSGTVQNDTLTDVRILEPSDQRVAPPCRHFKSCGGCQLQHASDDFVAGWKQEFVRSSLGAQGVDAELRPIVTSPAQSRRRATFAARRTKKSAMAGFHGRASDVIIEIPDCKLLHPDLTGGLDIAAHLALIGTSRKAALAVTVTLSDAGLDVSVSQGKPLDGPLRHTLAQATEALGLARLSWDGETIAMRLRPVQRFGKADVLPPPGAFLQATRHGEAALCDAVKEAVGPAARIADLFAGCGTFTLPLADTARVHAVEGVPEMLEALDQGWRLAEGLKPVSTEARDLYRRPMLPDELSRFDAIVLDPPRAGAERQVAEIVRTDVPRIAYVSCNPVTFARDAATLVGAGYTLDWVQVVDQFRWSPHTELAACFSKPV
ncbi:23S rRNA (uracil(1939)-C(5))-methyltransferase RlmD [Sulfitobacter sp. THAF37]|uniref:class I SAM-dependent RNA methyltransferase n=1 Tax=Sulfitobacter sp. THAF37 TaxID=2587855 RepID=UPI0012686278|nr:class I SAM-dependent RNA methyltransferase [Sulfitobacter sp. THAF37]QFT58216.1 23S rRNA (uracil(1939)-C(5))-methyltransferase RlmD [Sulfitobacter sp. THAF37]